MNALTFEGFEPSNTTPVPDVLFDVLLPYLNEAQLKVMLYIIRRTLGFKKTSDAISLNQFRRGITTKEGKKLDDGCGLKNFTTISKALKELEQMNCIESDKRETDEGNNLTTVYRIRFRGTTQNVVGTTDSVVGVLRKTHDRTTPSGGRVLRKTYPQETVLQQTDTQETELQEESDSDDTTQPPVVSNDTARAASFEAYSFIVPTTYVEALAYLAPHGGVPPGYTAAEVLKLAQKLYAEANEQDEKMFTDEKPQGDDHATLPASGHPHRVGESAAPDVDNHHGIEQSRRLASPDTRSGLEAQEKITEGEHHANRVPTLPATDTPASSERAVSRPGSDHSRDITHSDNRLPAVRPAGSGTPGQETGRDGRNATHTIEQTPPTTMPAQSLSLPQAEQAASGAKQEPKPLVEPDMSGKWSHEKCVEYAEWCNQRRYTNKMHEEQLKAAHAIHKNDTSLTLEQFKQAYDERNDAWWKEHKGKLHVNDMKARGSSGIDRIHEMLQRIEDSASRSRAQPRLQVVARQSTVKRYSSYDDPNFRSDQDFYPVEGGSYATASV